MSSGELIGHEVSPNRSNLVDDGPVPQEKYHRCPDELRDPIWNAGRFTTHQFFRVAAWKSARGLALLTLNSESEIAERTENAITAIREWRNTKILTERIDWEAWKLAVSTAIGSDADGTGLLGLAGVGYPRATAFISFLAPAAFPIIDKWTVKAVYGNDVYGEPKRWQRAVAFREFAKELVSNAVHFPACSTVHDIDQYVMNTAKRCEQKYGHISRPCSCYSTSWPVSLQV